jgi:ABC-type Fe3+-hydroxamate transport system substrate-binding protein
MGRDILMKLVHTFVILCLLSASLRLKGEKQNYPRRILSLSAAATHILTQLGQPPVASDKYGKIAAGKKMPPVIGRGSAISQEKLAELAIDCVVLWYYQNAVSELFTSKGLRVEKVPAVRLVNYPRLIMKLGVLVNKSKTAEIYCNDFKEKLKKITKTATAVDKKPLRVYLELYSKGKCAGDESYAGDLVRAAGGCCINKKTGLLSAETIIEEAPEVIFYIKGFGRPEEIALRPGFAGTPAVKNGKLYPLERRLITAGLAPLEAIKYLKSCMR